jgi:hypothetical protein
LPNEVQDGDILAFAVYTASTGVGVASRLEGD